MKIYKRMIAFLMAVSMILALTSCGGNADGDKDGKTTLKMIFWDTNQESGLVDMAEGYMKKNPDIKVTVETIPWDNYWTKLQAAATGGDMPDIVVMHPDQVETYAQGGMLVDLSDIIKETGDKFPEYVNEDFLIDGKYYGVPKDIGTMALCYNKDLFDAAGLSYPDETWTWDTLMENAEKLTDPSKDIYGMAAVNDGQNFYWNLIWQNGGEIFSKDGKTCTFDSPEVVEAMKYGVSFVEKGYSPNASDFANLKQDEQFESGKLAMIFAGSWMLTEYLNADGLNFDVAELPMGKERAAICSGMAFAVSANTKLSKEAKDFVAYLGSEEAQLIQAESGVAIPAYEGTQQPWIDNFDTIDASPYAKVAEYGRTSPGLTTKNEAKAIVDEIMPDVFNLKTPVDEACKKIAKGITELNK